MHQVDPTIIQLVEQRWRQYDAIVESVASPDEFIERVSQLLAAWSHEDAPLLVNAAQPEPGLQWDLVQFDLHALLHSPTPYATLQQQQAIRAQGLADG